ncbi:TPA: DNA cytosine methyltransferase, partial [Streptococcus suis]|nr:DNA cytosine methyltransferase [Streptococcus suis]
GVPQSRERAIILLTRIDLDLIWEIPTPDGKKVTLRDAIGHLPDLDPFIKDLNEEERNKIFPFFSEKRAKALKISKWHEPPHHIFRQVEVMQHTASGETAFDNEVFYPRKADGTAVKGYRNTYKRQSWDRPAYTVTMDNRKISSQNNVHPG